MSISVGVYRSFSNMVWGALVRVNRHDPVHPYEYGELLTRAIPGAQFREATPKSQSESRHGADVRTALYYGVSETAK